MFACALSRAYVAPVVVLELTQIFEWFWCLISISRERLGVLGFTQSFLPRSSQPGC